MFLGNLPPGILYGSPQSVESSCWRTKIKISSSNFKNFVKSSGKRSLRRQRLKFKDEIRRNLLSHAAYSPDLAPFNYHFFPRWLRTLVHTMVSKNGLIYGLRRKEKVFTAAIFINGPKNGKKM